MKFSIIIPYQERHPDRRVAITAILDYYCSFLNSHDFEIIVIEQGKPTLENIKYPIRYFFLENCGDFNKSWGMNFGAIQSNYGCIVFCDCDALIDFNELITSVSHLKDYEVVNPMGKLFDLPPNVTEPSIENATCNRPNISFASTISIFRKDTFFRLKGWEEGFTIWGSEDDIMSIVVDKFTTNISLNFNVFHIYHSDCERLHSSHNLRLMHKLRRMRDNILEEINKGVSIGDPLKYKNMNRLVYQIVIGETNRHLDECIQSVKDYAKSHGYDYECDTEIPYHHKDKDPRMASEWMRLEKLASRPYVLYVDWDLKILKDFELKDEIITIKTIDTLLYFGPKIELARKLLDKAVEMYGGKDTNCFGDYTFKEVIDKDYLKYCLPDTYFKHLVWHCTGKTFYKY